MKQSPRQEVAIAAVRAAARAIRKFDMHRGDLKVARKADNSLVTSADLAAEAAAVAELEKYYPQDGILSEELGAKGNQDSCWVLDPLDGTTNFVHGMPEYSVSLAWCKDGVPHVGVIYDICRDEVYCAETGAGAYCDQRKLKVSAVRRIGDALLACAGSSGTGSWRWSLLEQAARQSQGFRRIGSGALDLALVARGCMDAAITANLHYWDYAAGGLLVREAGGTICDLGGALGTRQMRFGKRLGLCVFGNERIAGHLRRSAAKLAAEHEKQ